MNRREGYYSELGHHREPIIAVYDDEIARRYTAALNACAGIPTEALEQGVVADLLAALEALVNAAAPYCTECEDIHHPECPVGMGMIAIARARGQEQEE